VTQNGSIAMTVRVDTLKARLDDPQVAAALCSLLDHADLIALLVGGLDAFLTRGDTIADSLGDGLEDLRATSGGAFPAPSDLSKLVGSLGTLTASLGDAGPLLERVIASDVTTQPALDVVSLAARALIEGHARAQAQHARVQGIRAALKLLKDDDVTRGLGFIVEVGRALGRELDLESNTRKNG